MAQTQEFYFSEPRLLMTAAGRMIVRLIGNICYGLLTSAAIIFVISDISFLRSLGFLIGIFLVDRLLHLKKSEKSLLKLNRFGNRFFQAEKKINAAEYLLPSSYRLIEHAYERSEFKGVDFFVQLMRLLIDRPEIKIGLSRLDIKMEDFISKLDQLLEEEMKNNLSKEELQKEISFLAVSALNQALESRSSSIEPKDLFAAVISVKNPNLVKLMGLFNIDDKDLGNALIFSRLQKSLFFKEASLSRFANRPLKSRHRIMNRAWTAKPTPFLDKFSRDLTDLARSSLIGFMVGHEKEYDQLTDVLSRAGNPNALLVGEISAGKNTIVDHLAFKIIKDRVPAPLFDKRLVELSLGSLSAGASQSELQERVKKIIDEIISAGNIILYIPEIHNLLKTGGMLQMSAADILIPAIKGTSFSVIGSTYPREFKQYVELSSDFASVFDVIRVNEINEDEAVKFLVYESVILEKHHRIIISFKAIKQAVVLAHKYFRQKLLPVSAEDLLKEALAGAAEKKEKVLTADIVTSVAERRINIPLHAVKEAEAGKLLDLENLIHKRFIDQEEAVKEVARAVREYRSGLTRRGGPIASFLFVGPTGVGKTELAKILNHIQFGDQNFMLRFDMSEYQDKQSFFRFIGSPDGSVRGSLTDAVLEKPYGLILLDEFEKAHPDILNLFLQVFDDGRLTDNLGRLVDFQNTIIIATSNAHSEFIKNEIEKGASVKEIAEQLKRKLTDYFKAELLNRFSAIIVFKSLSLPDTEAVAKIQISDLTALVRENQGIELNFTDIAVKELARLGYDPVFGARPLRRVISDKIRTVLAEKILKKEISRGSSVKVDFSNSEFNFTTNT